MTEVEQVEADHLERLLVLHGRLKELLGKNKALKYSVRKTRQKLEAILGE